MVESRSNRGMADEGLVDRALVSSTLANPSLAGTCLVDGGLDSYILIRASLDNGLFGPCINENLIGDY